MKYANIKFRILSIFSFLFLSTPLVTKAQGELTTQNYQPLESIPGLTDNISSTTPVNLTDFLTDGFNFLVAVAVVIAVVFITVGGFQYLTSTAVGSKDAAKTRIQDSIKGIVLILLTYIILYTINPNTVSLDFLTGIDDSNRITLQNSSGATEFFFKYIDRKDLGKPNPKVLTSPVYDTIGECKTQMGFTKGATTVQYEVFPDETCNSGEFAPGESQIIFEYFYHDEPDLDLLTHSRSPQRDSPARFETKIFADIKACEEGRENLIKTKDVTLRNTVKASCFLLEDVTSEDILDLVSDSEGKNPYITDMDGDGDVTSDDSELYYSNWWSFIFEHDNASSPTKTLYRSRIFANFKSCHTMQISVADRINNSYLIPEKCRVDTTGVAINFYESQLTSTLTGDIVKVLHTTKTKCEDHETQQLALPERSMYQIIGSECLKK
jgi:hypothetical protein